MSSDAQRLVALLDYVGGDYGRSVDRGRVVSQAEYDEQLTFLADARRISVHLLGPGREADPLARKVAAVEGLVRDLASPAAVLAAARGARDEAVTRFGLRMAPTARPALARAEEIYAQNCTACHGVRGGADTAQARALDPPPARFTDPARLAQLSPYRVYNTLSYGVAGTAMASFDSLSPEDRWNLAFYVFRLGHAGQELREGSPLPLADLAGRTDAELIAALPGSEGERRARLAWIRREAAFQEAPTGVGLDQTRRLLRQAVAMSEAGRADDADRLALDAYLQGFEPLEGRLSARDPEGTLAVERGFARLRASLVRRDETQVRAEASNLDRLLADAGGTRSSVPFGAAALIFLREGLEAALLVGALLAGARKLGQAGATAAIHRGWLLALPAGIATWWLFERLLAVTPVQRELVEAAVALLAAVVLFSMSFWLISHAAAQRWMDYLKSGAAEGLSRGSLATLTGVAFLAVYREAAETVLFTQALLLEAVGRETEVWTGAAAGLAIVVLAAAALNRTVARLPLRPFFAVSSALLTALAISFAGSGVFTLVSAGILRPRPVAVPEVPWMGIYPDWSSLSVQLAILTVVAGAVLATLRRAPQPARS